MFANSRDVAEYFGKLHKNVIRDIENLHMSDDFRALNFELSSYQVASNRRRYRSYDMTKDGFTRVVMSFTGEKAGMFIEAYIKRFNEMEAALKATQPESFEAHLPTTLVDALRMAADALEKTEQQQLQLDLKTKALEDAGRTIVKAGRELDVAQKVMGKHDHRLLGQTHRIHFKRC